MLISNCIDDRRWRIPDEYRQGSIRRHLYSERIDPFAADQMRSYELASLELEPDQLSSHTVHLEVQDSLSSLVAQGSLCSRWSIVCLSLLEFALGARQIT